VMTTTIWAYNVTVRPTWLYDGLLALLVRGEVWGKGDNAVELLEIYHIFEVFYLKSNTKIQFFQEGGIQFIRIMFTKWESFWTVNLQGKLLASIM
jgi:hypothetical protein